MVHNDLQKFKVLVLVFFVRISINVTTTGCPRAPVHIVTGSAGCQEGRDHFLNDEPKWSAFRSQDFGYTEFKAFNKTHIHMQQVSVDLHGQVIDAFWLVKDKITPNFTTLP